MVDRSKKPGKGGGRASDERLDARTKPIDVTDLEALLIETSGEHNPLEAPDFNPDEVTPRGLSEPGRQRRATPVTLAQAGDASAVLGDLDRTPEVLLPPHEILWHKLDHRAGFLLSRVDGRTSFSDIVTLSGLDEREATETLAQLVRLGLIGAR